MQLKTLGLIFSLLLMNTVALADSNIAESSKVRQARSFLNANSNTHWKGRGTYDGNDFTFEMRIEKSGQDYWTISDLICPAVGDGPCWGSESRLLYINGGKLYYNDWADAPDAVTYINEVSNRELDFSYKFQDISERFELYKLGPKSIRLWWKRKIDGVVSKAVGVMKRVN